MPLREAFPRCSNPVSACLGFLALAAGLTVHSADFMGQGYWASDTNPDPYETYVRISHDTGFYCVLDDKSSFRFSILGDSMTTPMNGMDAIAYMPGSGDLVIEGEEKGVPYTNRFTPTDSAVYMAKCRDEESNLIPVGIGKGKAGIGAGMGSRAGDGKRGRNVLGRILPDPGSGGRLGTEGMRIR